MNILIACEESQQVCKAFRDKGHNAFSCDIKKCSGGHPEWHIRINLDCSSLLDGIHCFVTENGDFHFDIKWDMIIAHPPCTDLACSGSRWFPLKRKSGEQRRAIEFFCKFLTLNCEKVAIENPINIINGKYIKQFFPDLCEKYNLPRKYTQIISPWMFGQPYEKRTCLWLKGLPPLIPQNTKKPILEYKTWYDKKQQRFKRQNLWYYQSWANKNRGEIRSKTFEGIAKAMAEQWG